MNAEPERWIWIARWEEFQHYTPSRERGPAWIKDYTAQLADERYLRLSDRSRALLRDLRDIFATMRGRLPDDSRMITRLRHSQTRRDDLTSLNDAGFIAILSREDLEVALEKFYTSRAPARSQEKEVEEEREQTEPEPAPEPKDHDAKAAETNGAGAGTAGLEQLTPDAALAAAIREGT